MYVADSGIDALGLVVSWPKRRTDWFCSSLTGPLINAQGYVRMFGMLLVGADVYIHFSSVAIQQCLFKSKVSHIPRKSWMVNYRPAVQIYQIVPLACPLGL